MSPLFTFIFSTFIFITYIGQTINPYEYDIYRKNILIAPSEYNEIQKLPVFIKEKIVYKPITDGFKIYHYLSGEINSRGIIKNKKREGKWIFYYAAGGIECTAEYKDGKKDGKYASWFYNGSLNEQGSYKNDLKEGHWISKEADGTLRGKYFYKEGYLIEAKLDTEKSKREYSFFEVLNEFIEMWWKKY
jgi:antitoxin component YwqK of YwqJK toxin-antitoxin module